MLHLYREQVKTGLVLDRDVALMAELETLMLTRRRGMLTPAEYAERREKIESQIFEYSDKIHYK